MSLCPVLWRRQLAHLPANPRRWPRAITTSATRPPWALAGYGHAGRGRCRGVALTVLQGAARRGGGIGVGYAGETGKPHDRAKGGDREGG
jgi:hypothetical protein